jgi:hypothetical protein
MTTNALCMGIRRIPAFLIIPSALDGLDVAKTFLLIETLSSAIMRALK